MRLHLRSACFVMAVLAFHKIATAQEAAFSGGTIVSTSDAPGTSASDNTQPYVIRNILISGNKKTNPDVILRELSFEIDEAYKLEDISRHFQKARKQLMNTGLFRDVTVSLKSLTGFDVYVNIEVLEKWYIWPKPFLRAVDKTFYQWWNEQNRNMDRINYGLKLTHNNFTGRNDKLKLNIMNGYTKQVSIQYYGLYLDQQLKWSLNAGIAAGRNREVNYMTQDDKLMAVKNEDRYMRSYFNWFAEVNYRPAIKTKHSLGIGYGSENVADTVSSLNPDFSHGRNSIRYPELAYRMTYFDVDFIPYPTKGFIAEVSLRKKGWGTPLNLWQLTAKGSKTWPVGQKYFFNASAVGMVKLPLKQPYIGKQFIGYDDQYLQGYEYYVVDGVAGAYTKATMTRPILNTEIRFSSSRIKRLNSIPLKIYAKSFVNAGYVYNNRPGLNSLSNKFLYSGGIGLDLVIFTDFVVKLEWSFNRLGENGLYLHKRNYF
jgi:outer membrane protein assembly factor BamA